MFYKPREGHGLPHDPFKAIVAPRPIGWISTRTKSGAENLAPYSFFNAVGGNPPVVMFSSEGEKDSVTFARESGVFACNFVSRSFFTQMSQSSAPIPRGESEFELTGLAKAECTTINCPRVVGVPSVLECVVTDILRLKDKDGVETARWAVFGEVTGVHIEDEFIVNGRFDTGKADPVTRMGYRDYGMLGEIFEEKRPGEG